MAEIDEIKPYGFMADIFRHGLILDLKPGKWDKNQPLDHFEIWREKMVKDIAEKLWPIWRPDESGALGTWNGASRNTAIKLTVADLKLMRTCLKYHRCASRQDCGKLNNVSWYEIEDLLESGAETVFQKAINSKTIQASALSEVFAQGMNNDYSASVPWFLKNQLQRPRAHQMAFWLNLHAPTTQFAASAWSPSAISGHAYQGLMGCLSVFLQYGKQLTDFEINELKKLAVDIGDRRVFAGVHYPSDNVMSWWVALEAIPFMAKDTDECKEMLKFATDSIGGSIVYNEMLSANLADHSTCIALLKKYIP